MISEFEDEYGQWRLTHPSGAELEAGFGMEATDAVALALKNVESSARRPVLATPVTWLESLEVPFGSRGEGIGSLLVRRLEALALEHGDKGIVVVAADPTGGDPVPFYERLGYSVIANGPYGAVMHKTLTRRNMDMDLRDLERRWQETGDQSDLLAWRTALNRTMRAPPGEIFYREVARRAAAYMRTAANLLDRAAENLSTQAFNSADTIQRQCRQFAVASKSAAARLSRSPLPFVSMQVHQDAPRIREGRDYWQDLMADASDQVNHATTLLREIAFDMERRHDKIGAKRAFDAVRWLGDLRDAISHVRDPNGGHAGRAWWDRHDPIQGWPVDRWWRLRGQPIPSLTEDTP